MNVGPGVPGDLEILVAGNPGPLTLDGTRSYVVGRERVAVVDPGPADPVHLERLAGTIGDRSVEAVCLTHAHPDHAAGAPSLARRMNAPLRATRATLERLGVAGEELADPLEEGDEVPIDGGRTMLRALETPGHSADSLSYLWLPPRAVFTGDLVLGRGTSVIVHPDGSVGAYLASLARLLSLQPAWLLPGHGDPIRDGAGRLEEYRRHRLERAEQIRAALENGAETVERIRDAVYGDLSGPVAQAAELSILAHLVHWKEMGLSLPPSLEEALEARSG